jgi:PAS domain S-box-containing protein
MQPTSQLRELLGLVAAPARGLPSSELLTRATALLSEISGSRSVLVLCREGQGHQVAQSAGGELDPDPLSAALLDLSSPEPAGPVELPAPEPWRADGVGRVLVQRLPGDHGDLVLAWEGEELDEDRQAATGLALAALDNSLARIRTEHDLEDLGARVDNAQQLADMGDYDWHIPTDTNRWSDQLYRIYGHEPQSFNASYQRFISLIHPEDRERISQLHQRAYETGEPYSMLERIVRPDGEVRYLSSNGQVVMDESGTPVRMRGTCIDVTDRVLAEREREHIAARFKGLVDSAPDAILVLDDEGRILEANPRSHELLGGEPTGHLIDEVLPVEVREAGQDIEATGLDGRSLLLDVSTAAVGHVEGETLVALFLHDAEVLRRGEAIAARLGEANLRRKQALEINDNVVQGLAAAEYALEQGSAEEAKAFLEQTLTAARTMMDDLLRPLDGEGLQPGDLVRSSAASIGDDAVVVAPPDSEPVAPEHDQPHRVLVVDDAEDLRMLLRVRLDNTETMTVVGEAADGVTAVEQAEQLLPDLVMLDLAMPRMDGLEALPLIKQTVPGVRVIVLSGFNQDTMAAKAMEAGADHYVVKGGSMRDLVRLAEETLQSGQGAPVRDT